MPTVERFAPTHELASLDQDVLHKKLSSLGVLLQEIERQISFTQPMQITPSQIQDLSKAEIRTIPVAALRLLSNGKITLPQKMSTNLIEDRNRRLNYLIGIDPTINQIAIINPEEDGEEKIIKSCLSKNYSSVKVLPPTELPKETPQDFFPESDLKQKGELHTELENLMQDSQKNVLELILSISTVLEKSYEKIDSNNPDHFKFKILYARLMLSKKQILDQNPIFVSYSEFESNFIVTDDLELNFEILDILANINFALIGIFQILYKLRNSFFINLTDFKSLKLGIEHEVLFDCLEILSSMSGNIENVSALYKQEVRSLPLKYLWYVLSENGELSVSRKLNEESRKFFINLSLCNSNYKGITSIKPKLFKEDGIRYYIPQSALAHLISEFVFRPDDLIKILTGLIVISDSDQRTSSSIYGATRMLTQTPNAIISNLNNIFYKSRYLELLLNTLCTQYFETENSLDVFTLFTTDLDRVYHKISADDEIAIDFDVEQHKEAESDQIAENQINEEKELGVASNFENSSLNSSVVVASQEVSNNVIPKTSSTPSPSLDTIEVKLAENISYDIALNFTKKIIQKGHTIHHCEIFIRILVNIMINTLNDSQNKFGRVFITNLLGKINTQILKYNLTEAEHLMEICNILESALIDELPQGSKLLQINSLKYLCENFFSMFEQTKEALKI